MIGHMRHGAPPRLMAPQSIGSTDLQEFHPTPSPGNRMTGPVDRSGSASKRPVVWRPQIGPRPAHVLRTLMLNDAPPAELLCARFGRGLIPSRHLACPSGPRARCAALLSSGM